MKFRISTLLIAVLFCLAPTAAWCQLAPYSQDFEGLGQADPGALGNDGWLVFGNVFSSGGAYLYGYGAFPAPNGGPGFSGIDIGAGGPDQGLQQMVVYNDYNNGDHGACGGDSSSPACIFIEANVFQEQMISADNIGQTWVFNFDGALGNLAGVTTARAFIKTLDPGAGFSQTNFVSVDMTNASPEWNSHLLSLNIDSGLPGQLLQFGFVSYTTNYDASGVFYDNIRFDTLDNQCPSDDDEGDDEDDEASDTMNGLERILGGSDSSGNRDLTSRW